MIKIVDKEKYYLLEGHFCLLNKENEVTEIPFETFAKINPLSLSILLGDISEIKERLDQRDNKLYDHSLLENMQTKELQYAQELSNKFGLDLNVGTKSNISAIINSLNRILRDE